MNEYYVYAYLRKKDGTPYYIGKGKENRINDYHTKRIYKTGENPLNKLDPNFVDIFEDIQGIHQEGNGARCSHRCA